MNEFVSLKSFTGADIKCYIPALAQLRIEVFREFPYLYDGDLAYEAKYLQRYVDGEGSVIVIAFDGEEIIGASTAMPLVYEMAAIQQPFLEHGIDIKTVFYFGESVLRKAYRGRGLGVQFFEQREAHAQQLGCYKLAAFCAVERPADHPRRPPDYVPLDAFWHKRGYSKHPELHTTLSWRDLDDTQETPKPMVFWMKELA